MARKEKITLDLSSEGKVKITVDYMDDNGNRGSKSKIFAPMPLHMFFTRGHLTGDTFLQWEDSIAFESLEDTKEDLGKDEE